MTRLEELSLLALKQYSDIQTAIENTYDDHERDQLISEAVHYENIVNNLGKLLRHEDIRKEL